MDIQSLRKQLDAADQRLSRASAILSALQTVEIGALDKDGAVLVDSPTIHDLAGMAREVVAEAKGSIEQALATLILPEDNES